MAEANLEMEIDTHTLSFFANAHRFLGIPRIQAFQNECLDGRNSGPNILVAEAVDKKPPSALPLLPVGTQSCIFSQNFPEGLWVSRHKLLAFVVQNPLDRLALGGNDAQRSHQPRLEHISKPAQRNDQSMLSNGFNRIKLNHFDHDQLK